MAQWNGERILEIARPHVGERYLFGAQATLINGNYTGPWDCAEFATWCAYQAYGVVFGAADKNPRSANAYSGQWHTDAHHAETLISYQDALRIPGAIVGRRPNSGGIKVGHVAISLGDGRTIEARSKRHGVVIAERGQRTWNFGVLIPNVDYRTNGALAIFPSSQQRILRVDHPLMTGADVRRVQQALRESGIDPGEIDGIYGTSTATAVHNFQAHEGLTVDGEVGEETATALKLGWPISLPEADNNEAAQEISPPSGPATPATYIVRKGDSLHAIAQRLGCSLDDLIDANPQVKDPNLIRVGDSLHLPSTLPTPAAPDIEAPGGTTLRELEILAKTIYGEARGEPPEGKEAIAFVVLNRIRAHSWWGRTIVDVCLHPWQFSCWNRKDPNRARLEALSVNDPELLPYLEIARQVLSGRARNLIGEATHYYAISIPEPAWVPSGTFVARIRNHRFYSNVA